MARKTARKKSPSPKSRQPSAAPSFAVRASGFWRRIVILAIVICAIPAVLTLVYLPPFVHPISTLMLGRYVTLQSVERRWVRLPDIAPVLAHSVLMSEDGRFCSHAGVDLVEMKNVVVDAIEGRKTRGASTLTMQTTRNLFLTNSRVLVRKLVEIPLAIQLDVFMPKRRIMEIYLNIAEWGDGIFGAEAAAQHYFKTSAASLTPRQAALLAAALPNPMLRNPARPNPAMRRVASIIETRAAKSGGYVGCLYRPWWWPL